MDFHEIWEIDRLWTAGIAEFAGLETAGLEDDGLENVGLEFGGLRNEGLKIFQFQSPEPQNGWLNFLHAVEYFDANDV